MITVQQAYEQLRQQLQAIYDLREGAAIAAVAIRYITGLDNTGRLVNKNRQLTQAQQDSYQAISEALLLQKPLQYVLHEAPFYGMNLYVDENVLIPRPETEELVDWIIKEVTEKGLKLNVHFSMLDIGTGSGCIPVALKKHMPGINMHALDISGNALAAATKNATKEATPIYFHLLDILDKTLWQQLDKFEVIVSNPPYITAKEAATMHNNVLQHEPHTALFVPDEQPLLFYEAIALFGLQHMQNKGVLFFEINEAYGKEIVEMLLAIGYHDIELRKDMQGKDRMIKAGLLR